LGLLEPRAESRLDRVLHMVSDFFTMERAVIALAGRDSVVVAARYGIDLSVVDLSGSFTEATMMSRSLLVVEDASRDPRFATNTLVTGATKIRLYVGRPLRAPGGEPIGVFAMSSSVARTFGEREREGVERVAVFLEEELARETDSKRAKQVQAALQPRRSLDVPGFEVVGASTPARTVGGDFYDWYPVPDGLGFTLADVMGKGYGAAIIAATVRGVVRSSAQDSGVAATVRRAARLLDDDLTDTDSFATLVHGKIRFSDGRVRYVDAGHGLTLIVRADGSVQRLSHNDMPLGTSFGTSWTRHTTHLAKGDTLIAFSDGVLDLFDGTLDSLDDVADVVRYTDTAADAVGALTLMAENDADSDDVVVIAIRREAS
jgi:serine phosphatase RsbU (regulator of sigma subunit)